MRRGIGASRMRRESMLFHFIRNLRRDCSGYGLIELALLAPQLTILAYYAFDL